MAKSVKEKRVFGPKPKKRRRFAVEGRKHRKTLGPKRR